MKQSDKPVNNSIARGAILADSVLTTNLPELLVRAAGGNKGIVYCSQETVEFRAYADLYVAARRILGSLRDRGLQPQDKVILQLQNPHHFLTALWGCWLGGMVPVPLGVNLNGDRARLERVRELCSSPSIISDRQGETAIAIEDLLAGEADHDCHYGNPDDLALLLFTSGSTGNPKGVMLSARNLIASVYGMAGVNRLSETDITLNWMPLEHVASLVMFHLTEVYLGCQQIQVPSELILQNPLRWLDLIDRHRVSVTWSPNFAYSLVNQQLADAPRQHWDLSCLRWMGNGAEAVVGKTSRRFLELLAPYGLLPQVLSPGYGMSETTSGITHANDFYLNLDRDTVTVGAPIPGVSLRIVDERGRLVPEGVIGLLQVKGATVTAGYYRQPELNRKIFTADGWFDTGDLGFLTAGKLTITGRQKEVIIINGVNYYSHEIEAVVEAIAGVTVSHTAACGVQDRQGQQIAIFFHTKRRELKLIEQIRQAVFFQIGVAPAYIIPVAKEAIPKTAIGKIQRSQLARRFAAGEFDLAIAEVAELYNQRRLTQQELPSNAIEQKLVEIWQEVLNLKTVSVRDNFFELGGNSLLLMQVLNLLTPKYNLSAVDLFQYPTIAALSDYLNRDRSSDAVQQGKLRGELRRKAVGDREVAIIGMSCRFPGANNLQEFWDNLCHGVESISFFEDAEVLAAGVDADLLNNPDYVKASPILDNIAGFDAHFWGYSPKEARLLDPQQRLFLECAWWSLEDAGYDPLTYGGDISLYGGAATNTYLLNNIYPHRQHLDDSNDLRVVNSSSMGGFQVTTANDKDYLTTRTSYKLNLRGSSVNVQTACSTSLVAVHLACQSLLNSECDLALAGAVSVHSPQKMGYLHQEGMILSADGHCRAFDADASGTVFGNGVGMVVLKLLDRAIADGDRIYGVIKGSAVNNDGGTKVGYFAPNVDGQARVVAEAIAFADIPPQSVSYVEAHGTGTKLGDPIEITALTQAYGEQNRELNYCAVGSVKTNVGHLQMASGIVGLIKAVLCLQHQKLVPSLHYQQPNPQLNLERSPFYINTQLQQWEAQNYPRRAGVNSLGIGGTNAHLILEEFVEKVATERSPNAYLLTLSAKTEPALQELVTSYRHYLLKNPQVRLQDICLTSNIGRHHFDRRLGIVASDRLELLERLEQITGKSIRDRNKIAWLFTGQGSQYVGMGQQLYQTQPVFRENYDRCLEILQPYFETPLPEVIFAPTLIDQTQYTQPLLFTIEYSLAQLWLSWGIQPDVVMGHSIGEYVAAAIAGVFSLEAALKLVAARGRLMQSLPNGAMLAVFADRERLSELDKVSLAADNGTHLVLSGSKVELERFAQTLEARSIKTKLLNVSHAFHSSLMQPIAEEFKAVAQTIDYALPQIPIVSNLTGELADATIATPQYWTDHLVMPVQFASSIKYLRQRVNLWLEIGTKPTLIGMVRDLIDDESAGLFLHSLDPRQDWQILTTLSQLYTAGVDIDWLKVTRSYSGRKVSLPNYPFQRQKYWFDLPPRHSSYKSDRPYLKQHPLLGQPLASPIKQTIFPVELPSNSLDWLQDHVVKDRVVFPGTAYLEMAIAAGRFQFNSTRLTIEDVTISSPLYLEGKPEIQLILSPDEKTGWEVYSLNGDRWQLHCAGRVSPGDRIPEAIDLEVIQAEVAIELDTQQHYLQCQQQGLNYGNSFRCLKQLWAKGDRALGRVELPSLDESYYFHPALLDSCLQILLAVLPEELSTATYIPVGLDRFDLYNVAGSQIWSYLELKSDEIDSQQLVADVWLFDIDGKAIAKLEGLRSQAFGFQPWRNWLYQPQWIPQPLLTESNLSDKTGTWLIFADGAGIGDRLVTLLKSQQQQCQVVTRNSIANTPEAFQDLVRQNLAGIIYLWSLDPIADESECQSYLYLTQALIQSDISPLYLVTRNAQPVANYRPTSGINNSCLWGMLKAIAVEHPSLSCLGIDLDPDLADNEAEVILQEICASQKERVAYRNSQRFVSRLVRYAGKTERNNLESVRLEIARPGDLDSLQWTSVSRIPPKDNEVEIEVKATGLNFRDVMVALDLYPNETNLGLECAGTVTAVGNAAKFQVGDRVMAIAPNSFSRYLTVNSLLAIAQPNLTFEEAATIPVTFLTAHYTLVRLARLQPGETVLIHAAAGGVGLAAIQIARQLGAEVVATASTPKWSLLKSLGVTKIANSRSLDFAKQVMSLTDGKGVNVVLNSLSGEFIPQSISVLGDRGRLIEIGKQGIWSPEKVAQTRADLEYSIVDLWQITQERPELIQHMLQELGSQLATGKLKPLPHRVFTGDRLITAFRYMQQGKHQGKIIITPSRKRGRGAIAPTADGTYLIAGGMGAVGLEVAQWLITKGVTNLVLLGRSAVKPELKNKLQNLQKNAQITQIKADLTSTSQLQNALSQIEATLPPLRGVIHCAGVTSDRALANQDWHSFNKVLAPKVQGAWNLHHLTQKYDLENFILFSSASSLLGSAGQVNYCAANAFLDALAHARHNLGLPAIAINWSAWQNTGMAANAKISTGLNQKGIGSIQPSQAIEILEELLLHSPTQVGVIPFDWDLWRKHHDLTPFYNNLVTAKTIENQRQVSPSKPADSRDLLVEIAQQVANILGVGDRDRLDLELGFSELGLDSLSTVELRNKLQASYNIKISATAMFDYSNITALANHISTLIWKDESNQTNNDGAADNHLGAIETLSEAEAEALLLEELKDFDL